MSTEAAALARLGGAELGRALRAGIHRLQQQQEHLDRINVFPVPDGDTGTNLALTMGAVLAALKRSTPAHAGQVLTAVADAALDGARGNSGAILAQFFLGVGDAAGHLAELRPADFALAVKGGASYAREALADPREGTILTVLTDVANELAQLVATGLDDFRALIRRALERGQQSLDATRTQLDVLARANVVDAGAAGFVILLEGVADYLDSGELDESPILGDVLADEPDVAGGDLNLEHRWCTECMVSGTAINRRGLREQLAAIGSSLVVAGTHSKVKVHVHVSDPAEVFRIASSFGTLSAEKADDMQRQQEATLHAARRQAAIVTDTAADIPDEELERLDVHVVPLRIHFGERSYLDKVSLSAPQFYRLLATSPVQPTTSQPPAGDFRRMFEFLSSHYQHVISINVTGSASGTRQAAESAASRVAAHERVTVIDSGNAAGGQALLVMHAAECALAGLGADMIIASVRALTARTFTFACFRTLDYVVRGGRMPGWARTVADLLRLAPYLHNTPDGRLRVGGFLRGRANLTLKFAQLLLRRMDPARRYRLIISHADAEHAGRQLLELLTAQRPGIERAWLVPLGTAMGAHGGPGALAAAFQEIAEIPAAPAAL